MTRMGEEKKASSRKQQGLPVHHALIWIMCRLRSGTGKRMILNSLDNSINYQTPKTSSNLTRSNGVAGIWPQKSLVSHRETLDRTCSLEK